MAEIDAAVAEMFDFEVSLTRLAAAERPN